ncbi:unnamed protein product [Darwinula stevensoni]|uniref:Carbonic anhydrase n=1 Tax=Darwinula stevensoni TaxID=69355 RepID=A0A7R9FQT1_9CRUS|nr:unnamed protein product [Darwinula stevensoni]CAG0900314.1 unnamed protein product [Darwinula stevensoni]
MGIVLASSLLVIRLLVICRIKMSLSWKEQRSLPRSELSPDSVSVSCSVVSCSVVSFAAAQHEFTYENNGAAKWPSEFPTCGGSRQSPIDLNSFSSAKLGHIRFRGYGQLPTSVNVTNNGHTVKVTLKTAETLQLAGGGLPGVYVFDHLHFHWGSSPEWGSEHTLRGAKFPMEMHIVHYNSKFANLTDAVASGESTAVAVLGFFFELKWKSNRAWDNLVKALAQVKAQDAVSPVNPPTPLTLWMPRDLRRFYRYSGSLTTPMCDQVVVWTIFETPIPIGQKQLKQWNYLITKTGSKLTNNFRPVQPRNDRKALFNMIHRPRRVQTGLEGLARPGPLLTENLALSFSGRRGSEREDQGEDGARGRTKGRTADGIHPRFRFFVALQRHREISKRSARGRESYKNCRLRAFSPHPVHHEVRIGTDKEAKEERPAALRDGPPKNEGVAGSDFKGRLTAVWTWVAWVGSNSVPVRGVVAAMLASPLVVLSVAAMSLALAEPDFTYEDNGAERWPSEFPTCGGDRQSPVDVDGVAYAELGDFSFRGYDVAPESVDVVNNGNMAKVSITAKEIPNMSGGGLPGEYAFDRLHFHWGSTEDRGSEHTLHGTRFPMEMHMVHYNTKFENSTEAIASGEPTAVAVLGFFFQVSGESNSAWNDLVEVLRRVKQPNTASRMRRPTPLTLWMPEDLSGFYRYDGSLTTPTCDQVVVWTLFTTPISIGRKQVSRLLHWYRRFQICNGSLVGPTPNPSREWKLPGEPTRARMTRAEVAIRENIEGEGDLAKVSSARVFPCQNVP